MGTSYSRTSFLAIAIYTDFVFLPLDDGENPIQRHLNDVTPPKKSKSTRSSKSKCEFWRSPSTGTSSTRGTRLNHALRLECVSKRTFGTLTFGETQLIFSEWNGSLSLSPPVMSSQNFRI